MKFLSVSIFAAVAVLLVSAQNETTTVAATTAAVTTVAATTAATTVATTTVNMTTEAMTTEHINMTTGAMTTANSTTKMTTVVVTTPVPAAGDWVVRNDNGSACMNMSFKATFTIKYWTTDGKTNTSVKIALPDTATTEGSSCNSTVANFVLNFFSNWKMEMMFAKGGSSDSLSEDTDYNLKKYTLTYVLSDTKYFPKAVGPTTIRMVNTSKLNIEADVGKYYKCDSNSNIKVDNTTTTLSDMKIQPFTDPEGDQGDNYNECVADTEISNIVPIAVGCALAGLVIIVLIAYLIGRSRSNRQGYQSV